MALLVSSVSNSWQIGFGPGEFYMQRLAIFAASLAASALLIGCSMQSTTIADTPLSAAPLRGNVHGGQQPVTGAHVYLFAAGNSGYGGASSSLLNSIPTITATDTTGTYVLTDSTGSFSISGDYACTTGEQLYLLATGGNPGLGGNVTNPALSLMASIGACPSNGAAGLAGNTIDINEVTTVATAYALAGFMTSPTNVSSSSSTQSTLALANAFLNIPNLVDAPSGTALAQTPAPANGSAPQARLNTIANILAGCVNSDGTGAPCTTLFANTPATLNGSNFPSDTATAAINMAHHQAANAANLFNLQVPAAPFAPVLTSAPTDLTLPVTFAPASLAATQIAVDASGDVYFAGGGSSITELQSNGSPASSSPFTPDATVTSYSGITIEATGNLWACTSGSNGPTITKYSPAFSVLKQYINTACNGMSTGLPGNVFTSNTSQSTLLGIYIPLVGSGVVFSQYSTNGMSNPGPIANSSTGILAVLSSDGVLSSFLQNNNENGYVTVGNGPAGIAIDSTDKAWVANTTDSTITATQLAVGSLATNSYSSGIANPNSIAVDGNTSGAGVWYSNSAGLIGGSIAGVPVTTTGFSTGQAALPVAVAPDPSGNLWTANGTSVTQFIGLSVPVATPVLPGQLGARP